MKSEILNPKSRKNVKSKILLLVTSYLLLVTMLGCDAFVRKFTRKPKKDKAPKEEMVLNPEEYKGPQMSKEEIYRQYFLFWKSWHDELIVSLSVGKANHKKQIDCANEAVKNLINLKALLGGDKQKQLDVYILQLSGLGGLISEDVYGSASSRHRYSAEQIKRNILRDFSYDNVKDFLL